MKRMLAVFLAIVTVFALAVPGFAAESNHDSRLDPATFPGSDEINIAGTYAKPTDKVVNCYYVTVAWTVTNSLKYTSKQGVYTWNPETTQYDFTETETDDYGWTGSAAVEITVTNKSAGAVNATCGAPEGISHVTVNAANAYGTGENQKVLSLASAAPTGEGAYKTAEGTGAAGTVTAEGGQIKTATCTIQNTDLTGEITANGNIAKITVSLAAA